MPWRGYPRRGCKGWVLGGCSSRLPAASSLRKESEDGFVCPGVLTSCLCQPSGQWWGLGSEGCGQDHWQGKGWMGWGWVGEGRSVTSRTSQPPVSVGTSLPWDPQSLAEGEGMGSHYGTKDVNHLGLQVFLGLTLTHIYMTEVLFCTPSNFPPCVLF